MLNKLLAFLRQYEMVQPGDRVVCAVSGGADSVALLFAMYLLSEKLQITLEAAHFNHRLRGDESDRDEAFVLELCQRYDIPLHIASGNVIPGKKGLEAAARDARYAFLNTLPGKIATAHTADDNAETVIMHLVRGSGLKGLGGIAPVSGNLIRPMLSITRDDVIDFLKEYNLTFVLDSSNDTDAFLRNRIRHHVMPLLKQENPCIAQNLSATAQRLRQDEQLVSEMVPDQLPDVYTLRRMHPSVRSRTLASFLKECGLREPEASHIFAVESLVFSDKPSAEVSFPCGIKVCRNYDRLSLAKENGSIQEQILHCPGEVGLSVPNIRIALRYVQEDILTTNRFTIRTRGPVYLRSRCAGDVMRLSGGTKELKKLFIDRKIPAAVRGAIPVLVDDQGVLGVYSIGANLDRISGEGSLVEVSFVEIENGGLAK